MKPEKVTDLEYAEKTLLGEYRLCSEEDKAKICAQLQSLLAQQNSANTPVDAQK